MRPEHGLALFTDGSASTRDRSGGWAWLAIGIGDGEAWDSGAENDTTNNRMEMLAWIEGLATLAEAFGPCDALVYSDSEVVGLGAMNPSRNRNKNQDLWELIDLSLTQHTSVEFVHVRGHVGYIYNERVDKLAVEARKSGVAGRL